MAKKSDQKVELIIQFVTEKSSEYTKCADAHKAFMALHGKVSYVHFNRKFRELCPHLKPQKKVRTLKPKFEAPPPPPKNKEIKDNKEAINYYYRSLRENETLLQEAVEKNDTEAIILHKDIRDSHRKAIIDHQDILIEHYEQKFPEEIKEIEDQLKTEEIVKNIELEKFVKNPTNILIGESDEADEVEHEPTLEESVSHSLETAATLINKTAGENKTVEILPERVEIEN